MLCSVYGCFPDNSREFLYEYEFDVTRFNIDFYLRANFYEFSDKGYNSVLFVLCDESTGKELLTISKEL